MHAKLDGFHDGGCQRALNRETKSTIYYESVLIRLYYQESPHGNRMLGLMTGHQCYLAFVSERYNQWHTLKKWKNQMYFLWMLSTNGVRDTVPGFSEKLLLFSFLFLLCAAGQGSFLFSKLELIKEKWAYHSWHITPIIPLKKCIMELFEET